MYLIRACVISILYAGRFVGRHCEKRRGTGTDYRFEEPEGSNDPNDNPGIIQNRRVSTSMGLFLALLSSALTGFLLYVGVLYKRFLATRDAPPPIEDGDIVKRETRINVVSGGNDNVTTME